MSTLNQLDIDLNTKEYNSEAEQNKDIEEM